MTRYADYCPIATGADVLGDRWTPLIIRELMVGADGFNDIHRGVPRMSRTLLAQRLRLLERRGLVHREVAERGRPGRYALTPAGQALTPIVWAIGHWAAEWIFGDPTEEDCDGPSSTAYQTPYRLDHQAVRSRRPQAPRRRLGQGRPTRRYESVASLGPTRMGATSVLWPWPSGVDAGVPPTG
jgi:DNA-binding HxlR family transcriptional regulator